MFRKVVAASLIAVWLALSGIEFSEDAGFLEYPIPDLEKSVEAIVQSFGEAIKASYNMQVPKLSTPSILTDAISSFYPSFIHNASLKWFRKETKSVKEDFKIYKLHRALLI